MKFSLRTKTVFYIVFTAALISIVGIVMSSQTLNRIIDNEYRSRANGTANSMAAVLDTEKAASLKKAIMEIYNAAEEKVNSEAWGTPEFNEYMALFSELEQTDEFQSLRQQLRSIQDVNDVDCIYLMALDPVLENCIYLVDGAYDDICPPGCIDPLYEENRELLTDPSFGFLPYITDTETYGWLVTSGTPVYDADGNIICYAMVDISMEVIREQQRRYIFVYVAIFSILTSIVCLLAIWGVNYSIIRPINQLSNAAAHYYAGNEESHALDNLQIHTKDEIQSLYESFQQMTHDIRNYIDNLIKTSQELTKTRIEADEMNALAHKDALTGVGSKLAYNGQVADLTEMMQKGEARYGIVMVDMNGLKQLNDTYGHEKGDDAIRNTCSLICDVFSHSPVYRIGGDEFVVVIKGRDYDRIEEKISNFKDLSAKTVGQPWERVNAAIGYALYVNEKTVDEVFRRADRNMYEEKKKMKDF